MTTPKKPCGRTMYMTTYASTGGGGAKKDDAAHGPREDAKRKRESPECSSTSTMHSNYPEAKVLGISTTHSLSHCVAWLCD